MEGELLICSQFIQPEKIEKLTNELNYYEESTQDEEFAARV